MQHVLIAGATGYLGRHLCSTFRQRGWRVSAMVRRPDQTSGLNADCFVQAQATRADSLVGKMAGVDLVVSALGITRQRDGLGYWDVDYQANANLLDEALAAKVARFAYIHVLNADRMQTVPLVQAKTAFVQRLKAAPIKSTVMAPSGFFSDMSDFLNMAGSGRVWLFGDGQVRINPIHGADLACATVDAVQGEQAWMDVGGAEVFSLNDLAQLCFEVQGRPGRVIHLPDWLRRLALAGLPVLTPSHIHGPARFFLTALGQDMIGTPTGSHDLRSHFSELLAAEAAPPKRSESWSG